ncbi:Dabb family protein [Phycisphaerales bacterium AB-hyl4]|uniref:Dabb family protein n=1 Tax=Natronomicrosphaera hydrolytica TaxID=3242702 RepID=A0ABV4U2S4_9BACT
MAVEHMVWIKFNDDVSEARKREHLDGLRSLKGKVPGIEKLAVGENFTDRSGGFTHGLLVTLTSRDALKVYADHPEHVAVAGPLKADAELRALDFDS